MDDFIIEPTNIVPLEDYIISHKEYAIRTKLLDINIMPISFTVKSIIERCIFNPVVGQHFRSIQTFIVNEFKRNLTLNRIKKVYEELNNE